VDSRFWWILIVAANRAFGVCLCSFRCKWVVVLQRWIQGWRFGFCYFDWLVMVNGYLIWSDLLGSWSFGSNPELTIFIWIMINCILIQFLCLLLAVLMYLLVGFQKLKLYGLVGATHLLAHLHWDDSPPHLIPTLQFHLSFREFWFGFVGGCPEIGVIWLSGSDLPSCWPAFGSSFLISSSPQFSSVAR